MPVTRSFTDAFGLVDHSRELVSVPNAWTLLGDSGLFTAEPLSQNTTTFVEQSGTLSLIKDQVRGVKPQANLNDSRKLHSYTLAHYPIVDALHPWDLQGKSAYGDLTQADTEAAALVRKMEKIRKSYAITQEVTRFKTLTSGAAYAPNGTVVANYYTDFGITRKEVDFVLGTATTDVVAKVEEIIASMQDGAKDGSVVTGVTAYCSPEFFAALISHAKIQAAYQYYSATANQEILRNRAGGSGLYRRFEYAGVTFIEVRTVLGGERLIPVKDAVFVANGVDDAFVTYFGPALRFGFENTIAMEQYMWTQRNPNMTEITVEAESNFLNVLRKPALVCRGYIS